MKIRNTLFAGIGLLSLMAGCLTVPQSEMGKATLEEDADTTLKRLYSMDNTLGEFVKSSSGYAVFPGIGEGGLVVGGAYGHGVVYDANGQEIGYSDVKQADVGALAGGQSYSEVIVFQTPLALDTFKQGNYAVSADASAVAINSGGAKSATYTNGVVVFVEPVGGLMAKAAISGQKFSYVAK